MTNPSEQESRAIISAFKEFIAFMQILRDYVGGEYVSSSYRGLLNPRPRETRVDYDKV